MAIIQEYEAKQYPDLYSFEIGCIDLLRSIKQLRANPHHKDASFTRMVAINVAQMMLQDLPELLRELEIG